jgi:glycosyltransferase involved in cell wall biosynthesis
MRILIVTPMPPDAHGSGAMPRVMSAQLSGLAVTHEVTLATLAGPNPEELAAADRLAASGFDVHAVRRSEPEGLTRRARDVALVALWARGGRPRRTLWFFDPRMQRALDRLLAERRFDVVAVEDNAMGAYSYPTDVPTVLTEHEVRRARPVDWSGIRSESLVRWALTEADWRRWTRFQPAVWSRFRRIQVFSKRDAVTVAEIAPPLASRVRVTPFGIARSAPASPDRVAPGSLLFVGNFWHRPNVDAALWLGREIMPMLRELAGGVELTIAGVAPPPEVRALASGDVAVTGPVRDLDDLYARAQVVLAPVRIGGGMRMKVLEALALGKPVVTTPKGVDGFELGEGELPVAVAETTAGFAHAVAELLADGERRRSLGVRARQLATEHYSAAAYARRLEQTYRELVPREDDRDDA